MGDSAFAVRDNAVSLRHRADRIPLGFLIRIAVVLWSVLLFAPWDPAPFNTGPGDRAYTVFSSLAFAAGHPWGSAGALHTGGPLAFLRFRIFSASTFPLLLLVNGAIGAVAGLLTDEIIRRSLNNWARVPLTFAAMALLAVSDEAVWLFLLLLSQLLIPEICGPRARHNRPGLEWFTWPLWLDLVACAIAANAKGQFLLMAAVLAIEIAVLELWSRRPPVVSLTFLAMLALLAHFAGFKVTDWGPYAKHILDSTSGYAESFALAGSLLQAALLLLSAFGLMATTLLTSWRSSDRVGNLIRWIFSSVLIWIAVKGALTRQDEAHTMRPVASLMVFAALYILVNYARWNVAVKAAALVPVIGLAALFLSQRAALDLDGYRLSPESAIQRGILQSLTFARDGTGPARARDAAIRSKISSMMPARLPAESSAGAFGIYQSLLLGHPGRIVTLPIVASYEIWTPWTSKRERDYLSGPDAPEYLLYTASPASAEVALDLTSRYREVETGEDYRLLQRRPSPLIVRRHVIFEISVNAANRIEIPREWQGFPAVAEVRYKRNIRDRLISALYQPPAAYLVLFTGTTAFAKIRMNALLQEEGVALLASPGVWDGEWLPLSSIRYGLLTDERSQVTAIGFDAAGPLGTSWAQYFASTVQVRIYIPEFNPRPIRAVR